MWKFKGAIKMYFNKHTVRNLILLYIFLSIFLNIIGKYLHLKPNTIFAAIGIIILLSPLYVAGILYCKQNNESKKSVCKIIKIIMISGIVIFSISALICIMQWFSLVSPSIAKSSTTTESTSLTTTTMEVTTTATPVTEMKSEIELKLIELSEKSFNDYTSEDFKFLLNTDRTSYIKAIGKCIADEFKKSGASVRIIDKVAGEHYTGDLADKKVLEDFAKDVIAKYGHIDILINNALPLMKGIDECSYEEFSYAMAVGVTAPFYLAKLFKPHFAENGSIINISSTRDRMSQSQTESYTAAKGGISALTHALAVSFSGKVRVNSISPGWIDTSSTIFSGPDAVQQPVGRVGYPLDIANMVLYLCSDKAGFITGENICIDGGMTKLMIYNGDYGWNLKE